MNIIDMKTRTCECDSLNNVCMFVSYNCCELSTDGTLTTTIGFRGTADIIRFRVVEEVQYCWCCMCGCRRRALETPLAKTWRTR